jgi:hypothetical protein
MMRSANLRRNLLRINFQKRLLLFKKCVRIVRIHHPHFRSLHIAVSSLDFVSKELSSWSAGTPTIRRRVVTYGTPVRHPFLAVRATPASDIFVCPCLIGRRRAVHSVFHRERQEGMLYRGAEIIVVGLGKEGVGIF